MSLSLGILSHIRGQIDGYLVDIIDIIYYDIRVHHVITHHISETLANYHFEKSYLQLFRFVICQLPQLVNWLW